MLRQSPHRHSPGRECSGPWVGNPGPVSALFTGGTLGAIMRSTGSEARWRCSALSRLSMPRFPLLENEATKRVLAGTTSVIYGEVLSA